MPAISEPDYPHIGLGNDGVVIIWAKVNKVEDNIIYFRSINGNWQGSYHDDSIYVFNTASRAKAEILWEGKADFSEDDYNKAIYWIQEQVNEIRTY